jgi:hypothetical protein
VIIVLAAGLGVCQLLGIFALSAVSSSPDSGRSWGRDLAPFIALFVVLVVLVAFASIALEEPAAWARVGVWVVSGVLVAGAVVTQILTGWAAWPFAVAVIVLAVPSGLLLTPSANAYFRRGP